MYGNFNPSTNAWPFTVEKDGDKWKVVDCRDLSNPVTVSHWDEFESAVDEASRHNVNHFRGA